MANSHEQLIIYNAMIYTLDDALPVADGIVIAEGKITALLHAGEHVHYAGQLLDAQQQTIMPGFIDAHCHLNAMIADAFTWRCPPELTTFDGLIRHFREQARRLAPGTWIRINHFNPQQFQEQRMLTKTELDAISSIHPIRVRHVSRHATVLNSAALQKARIDAKFAVPAGMKIDLAQGILYGADAWLSATVLPPYTYEQRMQQVPQLQQQLLRYGITAVHDATPTTSDADRSFWQEAGMRGWPIHIEWMTQPENARSATAAASTVKIVMESFPELYPSVQQLQEIIGAAGEQQHSLAIHTVTPEMIWAVVHALEQVSAKPKTVRLEHMSLCPPAFIPFVVQHGLQAVTNPAFIHLHGDRYLHDVAPDEHHWLYLVRSLLDAGIVMAAGSDAPVGCISPFTGIYAACTRQTMSGQPINSDERISRAEAFRLYTANAALVTQLAYRKGRLAVGADADFYFTAVDPMTCPVELLLDLTVEATWIAGRCVYQKQRSDHFGAK